jgi:enoyl-CoA hydratase/carnithine racemase
MPALAATRWNVTSTDPPVNLVDPELILGSVVLDGATAERCGVLSRALPDAELDGFVDTLAETFFETASRLVAR